VDIDEQYTSLLNKEEETIAPATDEDQGLCEYSKDVIDEALESEEILGMRPGYVDRTRSWHMFDCDSQ